MQQKAVKATEKPARTPSVTSQVVEGDPFGCRVVRHSRVLVHTCQDGFILHIGVAPDKDDPSNTHGVVLKKESIPDIVHAQSKDVGISAFLRKVKLGMLAPDTYLDDGQGNIDDTLIPAYVGDIPKMAEESRAKTAELAAELGIDAKDLTKENFETLVQRAVRQELAKVQQKAAETTQEKPSGGDK